MQPVVLSKVQLRVSGWELSVWKRDLVHLPLRTWLVQWHRHNTPRCTAQSGVIQGPVFFLATELWDYSQGCRLLHVHMNHEHDIDKLTIHHHPHA
jgi:hypothetical protein